MGAASSLAERHRRRRALARAAPAVPTGALETGDLLLVCRPKAMNFGLVPRDIVRGLLQAQRGTITTHSEKVHCQTWTGVAIVYRLQGNRKARRDVRSRARDAGAGAKCLGGAQRERRMVRQLEADGGETANVLYADGHGVFVKKLNSFVSEVMHDGGTVVTRKLRRSQKDADAARIDGGGGREGGFVNESWLAHLDSLYTVVAPTGSNWQSLSKDTHQHVLVKELLEHTLVYARRMPPSVMLQIQRYFVELSNETGQFIEGKEIVEVLSRLHDPQTAKKLSKKVCYNVQIFLLPVHDIFGFCSCLCR